MSNYWGLKHILKVYNPIMEVFWLLEIVCIALCMLIILEDRKVEKMKKLLIENKIEIK